MTASTATCCIILSELVRRAEPDHRQRRNVAQLGVGNRQLAETAVGRPVKIGDASVAFSLQRIRQLQTKRSMPTSRGVILSRLFAIFIALSLLFGPLAMDRAMAATPAGHAQITEDGHCQPAGKGQPDKAMSKSCCAAMCATAAIVPEASASKPLFGRLPASPASANFPRGVLSEISTPPPRLA